MSWLASKRLWTSLGVAAIAASSQAQQSQKPVHPTEQIIVRPATMSWGELLQLQASLPQTDFGSLPAPQLSLEIPTLEISKPGKALEVEAPQTPAGGGVEKLGGCSGFLSEPAIGRSFDSQLDVPDGMGFSYIPPDVAGGVGPNHLMTMLNNKVLVQDRSGATAQSMDLQTFWAPLGTTPASPTTTYPRVFYDDLDDRWLASARDGVTSTGSTMIFFAISQTDDPTGTWDFYSFAADPGAASFADWLLLGYNSTWITITANMFNLAGTTFLGSKMWTVDKSTALAGGPLTVSIFPTGFMATTHGNGGSSPHPARTLDADPTLWLLNDSFTSGGTFLLQLTRITGTGAAPVVSGLPGSPFGGTNSFCYVSTNFSGTQRTMAQVGEARFISPFSVRVASVAVRNGKIWVANSGGLPGPSSNTSPTSNGIVWHQLDPTLPFPATPGAAGSMVLQHGPITNGVNTMSMYPSIAVNCADDVLIGFANGDATISPRACYTMRLGTDALNFMGAINELKAGESTYWKNFGVGTTAQYGRYTSAAVDPVDDRTMWTLQEFADTRVGPADNDSRWGTRWGRLGSCGTPTITDEPDPLTVCVGDPASFTVVATASVAPLTYQWRKDGSPIVGETSDTYSIAATVPGDGGSYDVVVDDGCGSATSIAVTLDFSGAVISTQPVPVFAAIGDPASFSVVASGTGTLFYQWYHDGNPIPLATNDTYSIAAVTAADYGQYACVVTDDCGPVTSDTVGLNPQKKTKHQPAELSLHIFENPASQIGCIGDPVTLQVVAYPAGVTYEWRKNGAPIVPAETNSTLTFASFMASDAGNYDVLVSYGNQTVVSSVAVVTAGDNPVITTQPSPGSQTVPPGTEVTYSVTATGAGTLTYQWRFRPNVPFAPYQDIPNAVGPTLELGPVTTDEAGTYRCAVTNQCGTTLSTTARLIVL